MFIQDGGGAVPFAADATRLAYTRARLVLGIEPEEHRPHAVGEWVTFLLVVANRGPAGVPAGGALIHFTVDRAVTEIRLGRQRNVTDCGFHSDALPSQVRCLMKVLGPAEPEARVAIQVRAPAALVGDRLTASISVEKREVVQEVFRPLEISAAPRLARVRIKKSGNACGTPVGTWRITTSNGTGTFTLRPDGTYIGMGPSGLATSGLWKSERRGGKLFLRLGGGTPPLFLERYPVSAGGGHFEGPNSFGFFISGDKLS